MVINREKILSGTFYIIIFLGLMFANCNNIIADLIKFLIIFASAFALKRLSKFEYTIKEKKDNIFSIILSILLFFSLIFSKHKGYINFDFIFAKLTHKLVFLDAILIFLVIFVLIRYLFFVIKHENLFAEKEIKENSVITFLKYSMPILISFSFEWFFYFPSKSFNDTISQWQQIHNQIPFSNVHSVGHTMFLRFLLFFKDSYSIVIFVQILLISSLFGIILSYFQKKKIKSQLLIAVSFLCAFNNELLFWISYPVKDICYTICIIILVFSLIKIYIDKKELNLFYSIIAGLALAGVWLNRHNGILIFVFFVGYFIYRWVKYKAKNNLILVGISIFLVIFINFLAFNVFGALQRQDGTPYAIFGDGISSVVVHDGNITQDQEKIIDEILPSKDYLKKYYEWSCGSSLLWANTTVGPEGYEVNPYKDSLRVYHKEIIKLYFKLLPHNKLIMFKELIGSTKIVWQITNNPLNDNFILLTIILVGLICCITKKDSIRSIIPALPVLLNIISIMISATTNENRYLLPTHVLFFILFVFYWLYYKISNTNE